MGSRLGFSDRSTSMSISWLIVQSLRNMIDVVQQTIILNDQSTFWRCDTIAVMAWLCPPLSTPAGYVVAEARFPSKRNRLRCVRCVWMETGLNTSACVGKQPIMVATASIEHPIGCCCCRGDQSKLWCKLGLLLHHSEPQRPTHTAADLANHFVTKVDRVRICTADADAPTIAHPSTEKLSDFQPVTIDEIHRLIAKAPTKHCELDPLPT